MIKFFVVFILFISACSAPEDNVTRLNREAEQFCKCHGGVDAFVQSHYSYSLNCKDGVGSNGKGNTEDLHFYSSCPR